MRKRLLARAGIGFLLGAAADFVVPALLRLGSAGYSDQLLARAGRPTGAMLLSLLVIGLFGSLCMLGTLFYEIERWPLALATAAHYLLISLGYLIPARLLCWNLPLTLLLRIEGVMTLGFFLIWLVMYLRYRAEVRKLNELCRHMPSPRGESAENPENRKETP